MMHKENFLGNGTAVWSDPIFSLFDPWWLLNMGSGPLGWGVEMGLPWVWATGEHGWLRTENP